jgi:type IV secretory pathway TraG/TraD family ATPase VirD4
MSALNLLRAYRYPQVATRARRGSHPERFLDGNANTIYVVAAGHDQDALRPVILALVAAMYEAAIVKRTRDGPLDPRLFMLMDEAANIAPVRNLASWLSQCGDHGIVIATIWQSIAQIDQRYGRAARDAICAASTAQVFIPPLAEPTSAGYLTELLGEEPVANASVNRAGTAHAERWPSEGGAVAVAEADRPRPRDPDLPRPAARDRARTRLVRGPPLQRVRPAARGTWPRRSGVPLSGRGQLRGL